MDTILLHGYEYTVCLFHSVHSITKMRVVFGLLFSVIAFATLYHVNKNTVNSMNSRRNSTTKISSNYVCDQKNVVAELAKDVCLLLTG